MTSIALDLLDHRIIQALHFDPRAPFRKLADVLETSEQTVARRYRRLYEARLVRVVAELNSQRIGQSDWIVRIRCVPGSTADVMKKLARHPDSAWVRLASGGTEIFAALHLHDKDERTPLFLLDQVSVSRQVVELRAYRLLQEFDSGLVFPLGSNYLTQSEVDRLGKSTLRAAFHDQPSASLTEADWPLIRALGEDGRASFRQLAERTNWHESTVRRRVEELVGSGVIYFEVEIDDHAVGLHSPTLLWMSVSLANLSEVGATLAGQPEVPFVGATTGDTNLVATLLCRDDRALYDYLTHDLAGLAGIASVEATPITQTKLHAGMPPPRPQGRQALRKRVTKGPGLELDS